MGLVIGEEEATRLASFEVTKLGDYLTVVRGQFTRVYYVIADSLDEDEISITMSSGIPPLFSSLFGATCRKHKPQEVARIRHPIFTTPTILWTVTAEFDSNVDPAQGQQEQQPPEAMTPDVKWDYEMQDEHLPKDAITGEPIQTTAYEPIVMTAPVALSLLTIKRFEIPPFQPLIQFLYGNKINSHPFWGAPEGTAWLLPPRASYVTINGARYAEVEYKILFKIRLLPDFSIESNSWVPEVLNQGFRYLENPAVPINTTNLDETGNPTKVFLFQDGTRDLFGLNPVFLRFNRLQKVNLNNLNLGPFE